MKKKVESNFGRLGRLYLNRLVLTPDGAGIVRTIPVFSVDGKMDVQLEAPEGVEGVGLDGWKSYSESELTVVS